MPTRKAETSVQAVRRHLRNGAVILSERGPIALFGAAVRELAKIVDSPVGPFLNVTDILRDGPAMARSEGIKATLGAVFRTIAARYDPPLGRSHNPVNDLVRERGVRYHATSELTKPDGVVPARRPVNDMDFALEVPFFHRPRPRASAPIAAIVHAFYLDDLESLLTRLSAVPVGVDLFISTDSAQKRQAIVAATATWRQGAVEVRVFPNRGRDIAAKFVGFRDVYERYDIFLHLHLKRSPHGGAPLARWRDYLFDNLIGSADIICSNLALFDDPKIGIVFPQHLFEIRGVLNWGFDYDLARALLRRMGVEIDKNLVLEFPSGSMFWGRSAAIRPLLALGLDFANFPAETGQVDGTLAHAIERIVLMTAEAAGYEWTKVVRRDLYPMSKTVLAVHGPDQIAQHRLRVFAPCLATVDADTPAYARFVKEVRPIAAYPSRNPRPRLTLLLPTINPHQTFGGIATALDLYAAWTDLLGADVDRRIVVTDAEIEPDAYATASGYVPTPFAAGLDSARWTIVDASDRTGGRLDLRDRDVFVATAWWTASIARALEADRIRYFKGGRPFVYIIQDDEPSFYGWSAKSALAEATYRHADETIAVINSEELFTAIAAKRQFREMFCLPYTMNARISEKLAPRARQRKILVYGRPSVLRNGFELICESLRLWQQRDPIRASRWEIVFLGEGFEPALAYPVQNVAVEGKVDLEAYAAHLNTAAVGVSLMISPHPSYPPLEMAEAGVLTITNIYAGKDLRNRFEGIISLEDLHPQALSLQIEIAVQTMEPLIGAFVPRRTLAPPPPPGPVADPHALAALLRDHLA